MVWQFSTVRTTICCDVIPLPFTICHLPSAILDNHSEIDCPNCDVPNYTVTSSTHNGAMCHVKGIGTIDTLYYGCVV